MISALTLAEIDFVSGGVEPFCPDGFRVSNINYDGQGNITGWTCTNNQGQSYSDTVLGWLEWAAKEAVKFVVSFF